jgi:hypothetical protein
MFCSGFLSEILLRFIYFESEYLLGDLTISGFQSTTFRKIWLTN